jgi:molybdopterin-binding protein
MMKLSARNQAVGQITSVEEGAITALIKVEIRQPFTLTALITKEASEELRLKKGDQVSVIIKSTEVMISKE